MLSKFSGFSYSFIDDNCSACKDRLSVLNVGDQEHDESSFRLCEPCAMLIHHFWSRNQDPRVSTNLYQEEPRSVFVLVVSERKGDLNHPCDFLLCDADELYSFLPGGLLQSHETPAEGACRMLHEMTGLISWPGALEQLHLSHDHRGRLTQTFLCRAYVGDLPTSQVRFMPTPLSQHPSFHRTLHLGVDQAFLNRAKLQRSEAPENPLSAPLSKAASFWIESKLDLLTSENPEPESDRKLRDAYWMSLNWQEQNACRLVVALQTALLENTSVGSPTQNFALAAALAAPQSVPQSSPTSHTQTQTPVSQTSLVSAGAVPAWEADGDDSDLIFADGQSPSASGRETGGFVPPRK